MYTRDIGKVRRPLMLVLLVLAATLVVAAPSEAGDRTRDKGRDAADEATGEEHCVAAVAEQRDDGEIVLGDMRCYERFSAAVLDATNGAIVLDEDEDAKALFTGEYALGGMSTMDAGGPVNSALGSKPTSFTLGIHFDGSNGTGSSIAIKGSSCTGGYWNATGFWKNRISSSWNGCYRLRHYDYQNKSGSSYTTTGGGQVDNIASWFSNKTESVSYST